MPNIKLYSFNSRGVRSVKETLRELFKDHPDFDKMVVTVISSTVTTVKDGTPAPYIEVADTDTPRGKTVADEISKVLKADVEQTLIIKFTPTK